MTDGALVYTILQQFSTGADKSVSTRVDTDMPVERNAYEERKSQEIEWPGCDSRIPSEVTVQEQLTIETMHRPSPMCVLVLLNCYIDH